MSIRTALPVIVFMLLIVPVGLYAMDKIDYTDYLGWRGSVDCDAIPMRPVLDGDRLYVATLDEGVLIYDISQPHDIRLLGSYEDGRSTLDLAVENDRLYLTGDTYQDLRILDISDPTAPTLLGAASATLGSRSLVVMDDLVYVTSASAGLHWFDASDPTAPYLKGEMSLHANAQSIVRLDDYLYVAGGEDGLITIDITVPAEPDGIDVLDIGGNAFDLAVDGDIVYVSDQEAGLRIVDCSDRTSPSLLATVPYSGFSRAVASAGGLAFFGNQEVTIVDASDPVSPSIVGTLGGSISDWALACDGRYLAISDYTGGIDLIAIDPSAIPAYLGSVDTPEYAETFVVSKDHVFVGNSNNSLRVYHHRSDDGLEEVAHISSHTPTALCLREDRLYLTDYSEGLYAFDASDPSDLEEVLSFPLAFGCRDLAFCGDTAWVAHRSSGLIGIDLQDPETPEQIATLAMPSAALTVSAVGQRLYVGLGYDGLAVVDVSIPETPQLLAVLDTGGFTRRVLGSGEFVCIANREAGVCIMDLRDPTSPEVVGKIPTQDRANDIAIDGNLLYIGARSAGLLVVDIGNPHTPKPLGGIDSAGFVQRVAVEGGRIFLLDYTSVKVAPIQAPTLTAIDDVVPDPSVGLSLAASPNPFNPRTTLSFELARGDLVHVGLYDLRGRLVRTLADEYRAAGRYELVWDGRGDGGRILGAGAYLARVKTGDGIACRKLILAK